MENINLENFEKIFFKNLTNKYKLTKEIKNFDSRNKLFAYLILKYFYSRFIFDCSKVISKYKKSLVHLDIIINENSYYYLLENKNDFFNYLLDEAEMNYLTNDYKNINKFINIENCLFEILHNFYISSVNFSIDNFIGIISDNIKNQLRKDKILKNIAKNRKSYYLKYKHFLFLNDYFGLSNEINETYEEYFLDLKFNSKYYKYSDIEELSELSIHKYLKYNLEIIEDGLKLISSEVTVEDGRIDILAKDKYNRWVIIEIKVSEGKRLVWQSIYYPMQLRILKNIPEHEPVRFISFCPEYSDSIKCVLEQLPVELYKYSVELTKDNEISDIVVKKL